MSTPNLDDIATHTISRDGLSPEELARELDALGSRWSVTDGALRLEVRGSMAKTGAAAAFAGTLADELDHHPRIVLDRGVMLLAIRTPEARSVTVLDLVFAARIEQWLRNNGWPV
jgi:pterin-4a-carbinolamine dehydratase